jgi:hypothetical protein
MFCAAKNKGNKRDRQPEPETLNSLPLCKKNGWGGGGILAGLQSNETKSKQDFLAHLMHSFCSTTGKPTRSFATERVSLDSV